MRLRVAVNMSLQNQAVLILFSILIHSAISELPFIYNGKRAAINKYPYFTALGLDAPEDGRQKIKTFCGGTLITLKHVLTAAHCVYSQETDSYIHSGSFTVYAGMTSIYDSKVIKGIVDKITVHPNYDSNIKINDLAIVTLRDELRSTLDRKVSTVSLPAFGEFLEEGMSGTFCGFGLINFRKHGAKLLYCINQTVVAEEQCDDPKFNPNIMACLLNESVETCKGDSGGGLIITDYEEGRTRLTVTGVLSLGWITCGKMVHPSIYATIAPHVNWIEDIIQGSDRSEDIEDINSLIPRRGRAFSARAVDGDAPIVRVDPKYGRFKNRGKSCTGNEETHECLCDYNDEYERGYRNFQQSEHWSMCSV